MSHFIFAQSRARVCQFRRQWRIDFHIAERRAPTSLRENGQRLALREMARSKQDASFGNFNRRIYGARHMPRIDVTRMGHDACNRASIWFGAAMKAKFVYLADEFAGIARIKSSRHRGCA